MRRDSLSDRLFTAADNALKTLTVCPPAQRPLPSENMPDGNLTAADKANAVRLMRVNHAGEIAAQGLYHGQAVCARNANTAQQMQHNAHEETDHLNWCEYRVRELDGHTSFFAPFWYLGSFCIGIAAGMAGDRWSLGFVKETEDQVVRHLQSHLGRLSPDDKKTIAIIEQIIKDESEHAHSADIRGGRELPEIIKRLMRASAKVMTQTAYYL